MNLLLLAAEVGTQTVAGGGAGALLVGGLAVREVRKRRKARRLELEHQALREHNEFAAKHPVEFRDEQRIRALRQRYEALCRKEGLKP